MATDEFRPSMDGQEGDETTPSWDDFRKRLEPLLAALGPKHVVWFYAPLDDNGCCRGLIIRRSSAGRTLIAVESVPSRTTLESHVFGAETSISDLAYAVVRILAEDVNVADPRLLTVVSMGGHVGTYVNALEAKGEQDREKRRNLVDGIVVDPFGWAVDAAPAYEVLSEEHLFELVTEAIEAVAFVEPEKEAGMFLTFEHHGEKVMVAIEADVPMVEIWSIVVRPVASRRVAAMELAVRNRTEDWTTWKLSRDSVVQSTRLDCDPFVPKHVRSALRRFLLVLHSTKDDLELNLGVES